MERFKNGKTIHKKNTYIRSLLLSRDIVHAEPTMVEMEVPEDVQLTVCGDTHRLVPQVLRYLDSGRS